MPFLMARLTTGVLCPKLRDRRLVIILEPHTSLSEKHLPILKAPALCVLPEVPKQDLKLLLMLVLLPSCKELLTSDWVMN